LAGEALAQELQRIAGLSIDARGVDRSCRAETTAAVRAFFQQKLDELSAALLRFASQLEILRDAAA
jgi:hypothetical protein